MNTKSVADVVGLWVDPDFDSGLIERCRENWNVPIGELSNEMLATFLRQDIAAAEVLQEAVNRLSLAFDDDSELYEGELAAAAEEARERLGKRI